MMFKSWTELLLTVTGWFFILVLFGGILGGVFVGIAWLTGIVS
jgi:hypothetical protein